jgi:hypothetical protein
MKRLAGLIAVLTFGALVFAGPAGAAQPFMERQVQGPFTLDETCSFPVLFQPTGASFTNFFVFSDGEIFGSGPSVGTATNLDSGKTIKLNLGGASQSWNTATAQPLLPPMASLSPACSAPSFPGTASLNSTPTEM